MKLLDFGLAKLLDADAPGEEDAPPAATPARPPPLPELEGDSVAGSLDGVDLPSLPEGMLVGTPYYMSPEAWAGEELTARGDVYSLGLVLYELCAGRGPFRHVPLKELSQAVRTQDARPLAEAVPGVDVDFAAVVDRCLRRAPEERFASAVPLLDALEQLSRDEWAGAVPEGNPYRGLQAFEAEHRALFFGRRREQREVLNRLRAEPFLLVAGDSGVGKSSLCLAGVLPRLTDGALEDGRRWRGVRLIPGRRPAAALAAALAPVLGADEEGLVASLRSDPTGLARRLRAHLGAQGGLVLYVDQLEELVTLAGDAEAAQAGLALGGLAEGVSGVRVLATCRSDFLTRLTAVPGLGALVPGALYLLRALGPEEIREAVVGPARVKGVRFESEALVDALVASAAGGRAAAAAVRPRRAVGGARRGRGPHHPGRAGWAGRRGGRAGEARGRGRGAPVAGPAHGRARRAAAPHHPGGHPGAQDGPGAGGRRPPPPRGAGGPGARAPAGGAGGGRWHLLRGGPRGAADGVGRAGALAGRGRRAPGGAGPAGGRLRALGAHGPCAGLLWGPRQLAEAARLEREQLTRRELAFLEASRRTVVRSRRMRRALAAGFVLSLALVYVGLRMREAAGRDSAVRALAGPGLRHHGRYSARALRLRRGARGGPAPL